jgi:hypothetical protein
MVWNLSLAFWNQARCLAEYCPRVPWTIANIMWEIRHPFAQVTIYILFLCFYFFRKTNDDKSTSDVWTSEMSRCYLCSALSLLSPWSYHTAQTARLARKSNRYSPKACPKTQPQGAVPVPSGNDWLTVFYGKCPSLIGQSTISTGSCSIANC